MPVLFLALAIRIVAYSILPVLYVVLLLFAIALDLLRLIGSDTLLVLRRFQKQIVLSLQKLDENCIL